VGPLYLSSLCPKSRLPNPNNISWKEAMATKNVASQVSKKTTESLSRKPWKVGTIPKRQLHGMEKRSMAKVVTVIVVRQMTTPSPKQQDL